MSQPIPMLTRLTRQPIPILTTLTCPKKVRRAKGHIHTSHDTVYDRAHAKAYAKAYYAENRITLAVRRKLEKDEIDREAFNLRQKARIEQARIRARSLLLQSQKESRDNRINQFRILLKQLSERKLALISQIEQEDKIQLYCERELNLSDE